MSCHHHLHHHWLFLNWSSWKRKKKKVRSVWVQFPVPVQMLLLEQGRRSSRGQSCCRNTSAATFLDIGVGGQTDLESNIFRCILVFFMIINVFFTFQIESIHRPGVFPVDLFTQYFMLAVHFCLSHVFVFSFADVYNYSLKCFHFLWSLNVNEVTFLKIIVAFSGQKPCS